MRAIQTFFFLLGWRVSRGRFLESDLNTSSKNKDKWMFSELTGSQMRLIELFLHLSLLGIDLGIVFGAFLSKIPKTHSEV